MTFDEVQETLVARGWRRDADGVSSPSGGFWFDRHTFERDIRAVYYPAARRVHSFPHSSNAKELQTLLVVLGAEPSLALLNARLTAVQARLASFGSKHAMTISLWAFGYPSVRATARHPSGGIAVAECVLENAPGVDLHAYHWIDDHQRSVRLSRRQSFPRLFDAAEIDIALDQARAFLLLSPNRANFESAALAPDETVPTADAAYWTEFAVLC